LFRVFDFFILGERDDEQLTFFSFPVSIFPSRILFQKKKTRGPAPGAAMAPASSLMGSGFLGRGAGGGGPGNGSSFSGLNAGTGIGICAAEAAASLRAPAGAPPSAFEALAASLSASRGSGSSKTLSSSPSPSPASPSPHSLSSSPPRSLTSKQHSIKMIPLLDFEVGAAALPHPEKVQRDGAKAVCRLKAGHAGEDAYFSEELPQNRGVRFFPRILPGGGERQSREHGGKKLTPPPPQKKTLPRPPWESPTASTCGGPAASTPASSRAP